MEVKKQKAGDAYQEAVAQVATSISPTADIDVGVWMEGPDGRRDLDVAIRENGVLIAVIECKDWSKPVGIALIDALDSKRRDIGASVAMICSNSGFTADALRKAARVGIPTLAALIEGDNRIKVIVREQIYTRIVEFTSHSTSFHHPTLSDEQRKVLVPPVGTNEWTYREKPVEAWVATRLIRIAYSATHSRSIQTVFKFEKPISFSIRGIEVLVDEASIHAAFKVQWMTQIAELSASQGMYNYLHKVVVAGPGEFQFHVKNIDSQTWGSPVAVEDVPPQLLAPYNQRENPEMPVMEMSFMMLKNMPQSDPNDASEIDPFITSEETQDE